MTDGPTRRRRVGRRPSSDHVTGAQRGGEAVLVAALVVLWVALGAPWLPAVAAGSVAVLVWRRVVPRPIRRPVPAAAVVGAVVLAVEVSGWVWPLLAAGALLAVLPTVRVRGRDRRRAPVLLVVAGVLAVVGTAGLAVEHL